MTATIDLAITSPAAPAVADLDTEPDLDEQALSIVVIERVPMKLIGDDRAEAVRRLIAKKVPSSEIARLLCTSTQMVQRIRTRYNLPPTVVAESSWWLDYLYDRKRRLARAKAAAKEG